MRVRVEGGARVRVRGGARVRVKGGARGGTRECTCLFLSYEYLMRWHKTE